MRDTRRLVGVGGSNTLVRELEQRIGERVGRTLFRLSLKRHASIAVVGDGHRAVLAQSLHLVNDLIPREIWKSMFEVVKSASATLSKLVQQSYGYGCVSAIGGHENILSLVRNG